MRQNEIDRLILRVIDNSISEEESAKLTNWLNEDQNIDYFNDFVRVNQLINYKKKFEIPNTVLNYFESTKKRGKTNLRKRFLIAAASIVIFISLTLVLKKNTFTDNDFHSPVIVNKTIEIGTDKATLTLEDGTLVPLEKGSTYIKENLRSDGQKLIYDNNRNDQKEMAYNYLTIPRGGQFFVVLPDGTQVWLNSESQLRYPINFIEGVSRVVELVYGEAYFDVSPSTNHKGSIFKVLHNKQEVEVLGTKFNIKAYKDETNVLTTLVEGRVKVHHNKETQNLLPGQQSVLNLNTNSLVVRTVEIYNAISWKDGIFNFDDITLREVMKVLSRWYDMDVIIENEEMENLVFAGKLKKQQPIEDILDAIKNSSTISNYMINNKTIIIK